jgi:hypothetical protein
MKATKSKTLKKKSRRNIFTPLLRHTKLLIAGIKQSRCLWKISQVCSTKRVKVEQASDNKTVWTEFLLAVRIYCTYWVCSCINIKDILRDDYPRYLYGLYNSVNRQITFRCVIPVVFIQSVPLPSKPGISLIILTPMKILQRNLNSSTFFSFTFLTQWGKSASNFVAISSLVVKLLNKCRVR